MHFVVTGCVSSFFEYHSKKEKREEPWLWPDEEPPAVLFPSENRRIGFALRPPLFEIHEDDRQERFDTSIFVVYLPSSCLEEIRAKDGCIRDGMLCIVQGYQVCSTKRPKEKSDETKTEQEISRMILFLSESGEIDR